MPDTPIKLAAPDVAIAAPEARTIAGRILSFGVPSSAQRVTVQPGALTPRDPLARVKLLIDHDHAQPIGWLQSLDVDDTGATARFKVAPGPAGDAALASAKDGLRDGLSVGIAVKAATRTSDGGINVTAAELYEVSLVAVPDFADASVTEITAAALTKEHTMTEPTTTNTGEQPTTTSAPPTNAGPTTITSTTTTNTGARADNITASTPERQFAAPTVTERALDLNGAVRLMADAINSGSPDSIRLALQDIVPSDDQAKAFIGRDNWLGELWTAVNEERYWIDAFGPTQQLTSLKGTGYRWKQRPKPGKYAGNKTEVPTNKASTEAVEFTAERWAGGWDIDRIFIDLGAPEFLESFWRAAMAEYQVSSNADIGEKVVEAATESTAPGVTTALGAVKALASEMRAIGANPSTIFIAPNLFDEWSELKTSEVPFWLANAVGGVDLNAGTVEHPGGLSLRVAADLDTGTVVAIDKRAAIVREKTPIRINGVDIARGGVDLGFYSYGRLDVQDPRAIRKLTMGAGA